MNNSTKIATGILGGVVPSACLTPKSKKGFWYWLVIFPIKWTVIITIGLMVAMVVFSFAIIAFIPWVIVRAIQHKPLIPNSLARASKTKTK